MSQIENLSITTFLEKANNQLQQNLPFVLYNKPNSKQLIGLFQKNNSLYFIENFDEVGFVFAPFDGEKVIIPENQSQILIADFEIKFIKKPDFKTKFEEDIEAKNKYLKLVKKGINVIESGELTKVVLSRKEIVELTNFDAINFFQRLINEYPTAFTYFFFHPKVGMWLGAFSEQLLKLENTFFQTAAVAGTQLYEDSKNTVWKNKEKQEQLLVTDFILDKLKKVISNCTISEPYTLKAGNLVHIKTDIKGTLNANSDLKEILEILHPTPAVCGLPTHDAKNFILENEDYKREFYSGYLGEINKDFSSEEQITDLYVNLRCVKVESNTEKETAKAHLYVGCGITIESNSEKEWTETVNKSMTMMKILNLEI